MRNAREWVAIGDVVECEYNGKRRYGKVESIAADGSWFKIECDGEYRTLRSEKVPLIGFWNYTVEADNAGEKLPS